MHEAHNKPACETDVVLPLSQGVTLTDLQEAERTFSRSRVERQAQEQQSEKPESTEDGGERKEETRPWWNRNLDEEVISLSLLAATSELSVLGLGHLRPRTILLTASLWNCC